MNLLTGKMISRCNVIPITITQEVIDRVESQANKYGIKSPLKLKYCKEVTIREYDNEHDDDDASIARVDYEYE